MRHVARQTGFSQSSVQRLTQAMERRDRHPESWLWDTGEGRHGLLRLVVATLSTFGRKRGVGAETLPEFFVRRRWAMQVGCSPSAVRGGMSVLAQTTLEVAQAWEQESSAAGETPPIIGAVDETFVERMLLGFMDLVRGSLVFAEVAPDRPSATWHPQVKARREALGVGGVVPGERPGQGPDQTG
jgi:hypothetical protein